MKKTIETLSVPKTYSLKESFISQSQCIDFMQCKMKWLYRINGLTSFEGQARIDFGSIFHALLCKLYKNGRFLDLKQIDFELTKIKKSFADTEVSREMLEYDLGVASVLFVAYQQHYSKEFNWNKYSLQEEILKGISGIVRRMVKLDAAFFDQKEKFWIMEHKCFSRIDEFSISQALNFDFQNLWSVTLFEQVMQNKVVGVVYNIIRNPSIKQKQTETFYDFLQRLSNDISERPEFYFIRNEVIYSEADRQRFLNVEMAGVLEEIRYVVEQCGRCYRNSKACFTPYKCAYLEACSTGDYSCLISKVNK